MNPIAIRRLLDHDQAADYVAELSPSRPVRRLAFESVWAKPGRYFNVCYRVDDGERERLASLCLVDASDAAKALRRVPQATVSVPGEDIPARMVADDVLAQSFPFDYRLPQLPECLRPSVVRDVLGDHPVDTCEMAAYRPGMRCQIRYKAGGTAVAYGKTSVERDPGRRRRVHRDLFAATAAGSMRIPALLGGIDALGLDLVQAVPGRNLHDLLAAAPDAGAVKAAAANLAELHASVEAPHDRVYTASDELELARTWAEWMSEVEPALAPRLGEIFASLASTLPQGVPTTFAHRDFYDKQILVDGDRLWLLDVDTACTGDAELDLGNFLSQLFLRGLQWQRSAAHGQLEETARDAYEGPLRDDVLRWYRRTSLLRLACVYQLRPHWRHVVQSLLDEATAP